MYSLLRRETHVVLNDCAFTIRAFSVQYAAATGEQKACLVVALVT